MPEFKLKDYDLRDTIAATATFPSKSALGVIKISGKNALTILSKIFIPKRKKNIKKVKTYTLHYGWIRQNVKNKSKKDKDIFIDEVLVSVMKAPNSYTTEDVVEISSHGGIVSVNKILEIVLNEGARLALPGEFTYRALIKGRIDLLQVESISGIVEAKSEKALIAASSQLKGGASVKIKRIKEKLKELLIQTEAVITFPEDEIEFSYLAFGNKMKILSEEVFKMVEGSNEAKILKEGLKCVICGKTNAGKSTLFNRILKEERVIVSRFAGTTRDVIEETINIKGVPLRIYDTAGILEPKDLVTKKAIEKTSDIFNEADLVILVFDGSRAMDKDDFFLLEKASDKDIVLVINKVDLPNRLDLRKIKNVKGPIVKMSALKNNGLKKFEEAIYKMVHKSGIEPDDIIFMNHYQRQILNDVFFKIEETRKFIKDGYTVDFISLSLKECLDDLGKISGEVFSEEILEGIFSNFCIGK